MGPTETTTPFPGWGTMALWVIAALFVVEAAAWGARRLHRKAQARNVRMAWWQYVVVAVFCGAFVYAVDFGRLIAFPALAWHWTTYRCWRAARRNPAQPAQAPPRSSLRPIPMQVLPHPDACPPDTSTVVTPDGQEWLNIAYATGARWEPACIHPIEDRPLVGRLLEAVRGGR